MLECEGKRREGMRCRNGDTRLLLSHWSRSLLVAKDGSYRRHQTNKAMSMQVRNHGAKGHDNQIHGHGSQLYLSKSSSWYSLFGAALDTVQYEAELRRASSLHSSGSNQGFHLHCWTHEQDAYAHFSATLRTSADQFRLDIRGLST